MDKYPVFFRKNQFKAAGQLNKSTAQNIVEQSFYQGDNKGHQQQSKYISTEEACEYLQVSSRTLQRMRDNGQIKFYQFGRNIRYTYADLDAFMQESAVVPFNVKKGGGRYV